MILQPCAKIHSCSICDNHSAEITVIPSEDWRELFICRRCARQLSWLLTLWQMKTASAMSYPLSTDSFDL